MNFRRHPLPSRPLEGIKRRPTAIVLMIARPLLASLIQESLSNVFPDCAAAVQANGVRGLYFHGPLAAPTGNAQDVTLDVR
jgi:hypothetical protein